MASEDKTEAMVDSVLTLLLVPVTILSQGFVSAKLWLWHVVPVLSVPPIGMAAMVGLSTFIYAFFGGWVKHKQDEGKSSPVLFARVAGIWLALLIGWLAT